MSLPFLIPLFYAGRIKERDAHFEESFAKGPRIL